MTIGPPHRPPLDPSALEPLPAPWTGVEVLAETSSTNAVLAERARAGAAEGLVVVAEHQTAGRGRLDRSWETPTHAALTFSLLLAPRVAPDRWPWLPLLTGLALAEAVEEATSVHCEVKWPNDLLHDGLKLAGVLVERVARPAGSASSSAAAVVGVGLNVSTTDEELPVPTATSLALAGAGDLDRTRLLATVLRVLGRRYVAWVEVGGDAERGLREAYAARCATLGRQVRVDLPGDVLEGTATGIAPDGALEVRTGQGAGVRVSAGDVVHVRAV